MAERLRRGVATRERLTTLALDVSINGSDLAVALQYGEAMEGATLYGFKQTAGDLAELQALLRVEPGSREAVALDEVHPRWAAVPARLAVKGRLTGEDVMGLVGAMGRLPEVVGLSREGPSQGRRSSTAC